MIQWTESLPSIGGSLHKGMCLISVRPMLGYWACACACQAAARAIGVAWWVHSVSQQTLCVQDDVAYNTIFQQHRWLCVVLGSCHSICRQNCYQLGTPPHQSPCMNVVCSNVLDNHSKYTPIHTNGATSGKCCCQVHARVHWGVIVARGLLKLHPHMSAL